MILSAIFSPAKSKKTGGRFGSLLSFFLSFLIIFGFLIFAPKIVKEKSISVFKQEPVLGFRNFLPSLKPYPVNKGTILLPSLSAKSVIVVDADSAAILYQKEADLKLSPASTTKMVTAIVALENYPLDKVLTVGNISIDKNALVKLVPGEKITVENLLYCLLLGSSNESAQILAENFSGGVDGFVASMNQKTADFKLENTHFSNPIGLDGDNLYSTARDLARLAIEVVKKPVLSKIVSQQEVIVTDVSGATKHVLKNTNELVGKVAGVEGVKTGRTENAGECLVSWVEREGRNIVIVVLGSQKRFEETTALIDWVFNNFEWKIILPTQ